MIVMTRRVTLASVELEEFWSTCCISCWRGKSLPSPSPLPLSFRGLGQIQDVSEGRRLWASGATAEDKALLAGIFVKGADFAAERCGKICEADAMLMRDAQRGQMIGRPALATFMDKATVSPEQRQMSKRSPSALEVM